VSTRAIGESGRSSGSAPTRNDTQAPAAHPVSVLIADRHRLFMLGLRSALERTGEFRVLGETHDGAEVPGLARALGPDLVLLDLEMPRLDGLRCLDRLRGRGVDVPVVLLAGHANQEAADAARARGACGILLKSTPPERLPQLVRAALEGARVDPEEIPLVSAAAVEASGLTSRELEILDLAAHALASREIGRRLDVSEQTVKFHLTNIYRKLGVRSRTEACRCAVARGLVANPLVEWPADGDPIPAPLVRARAGRATRARLAERSSRSRSARA
jgi:DNA-binding NarL/FixJ family response regulator